LELVNLGWQSLLEKDDSEISEIRGSHRAGIPTKNIFTEASTKAKQDIHSGEEGPPSQETHDAVQ
jgi:hypothetical protein